MNDYISGEYYQEVYSQNCSLKKHTRWQANYFKVVKFLFPAVDSYKNGKILEVGSSFGGFINLLNKRGFKNVYASDTNKDIFPKSLANPFQLLDLTAEKPLGEKFDIIFAFDVLEHIYEREIEKVVRNLQEGLNDRGLFIFCVPYPIEKHLRDKYHVNMQFPPYYVTLFTKRGFQLLNSRTVSFVPYVWRFGTSVFLCRIFKSRLFITETFFVFRKLNSTTESSVSPVRGF